MERIYFDIIPKELYLLIIGKINDIKTITLIVNSLDLDDVPKLIQNKSIRMGEMLKTYFNFFESIYPSRDKYKLVYLALVYLDNFKINMDEILPAPIWEQKLESGAYIYIKKVFDELNTLLRHIDHQIADIDETELFFCRLLIFSNFLYIWNRYFFNRFIGFISDINKVDFYEPKLKSDHFVIDANTYEYTPFGGYIELSGIKRYLYVYFNFIVLFMYDAKLILTYCKSVRNHMDNYLLSDHGVFSGTPFIYDTMVIHMNQAFIYFMFTEPGFRFNTATDAIKTFKNVISYDFVYQLITNVITSEQTTEIINIHANSMKRNDKLNILIYMLHKRDTTK